MFSLLQIYRFFQRLYVQSYTKLHSSSFKNFGKKSVICPPLRLSGEGQVLVGKNVTIGSQCWIQVIGDQRPDCTPRIKIGDGCSFAGFCTLSAVHEIEIGCGVLIARNVHISDHRHAFSNPFVPILMQGVEQVGKVTIGDGTWIGHGVVICPGVSIGKNCVIGANSVVTRSVPDRTVAAGAPARIIRKTSI